MPLWRWCQGFRENDICQYWLSFHYCKTTEIPLLKPLLKLISHHLKYYWYNKVCCHQWTKQYLYHRQLGRGHIKNVKKYWSENRSLWYTIFDKMILTKRVVYFDSLVSFRQVLMKVYQNHMHGVLLSVSHEGDSCIKLHIRLHHRRIL